MVWGIMAMACFVVAYGFWMLFKFATLCQQVDEIHGKLFGKERHDD
jgi:hypothetical protein